jgi:hypothetical protein
MTRRAPVSLATAALALYCAAAGAATQTTAYAGLEVGDTDSNRLDAGVAVQFLERWRANASVARAHVAFPDVSTNSTLVGAKLGYDVGPFSVGGGYRHGEIEDVSTSRGWLVSGAYVHREVRFGLEIEARDTTLEPAVFTEDLGGTLGIVSGVSHCSVAGRGYQGRVDWDRPTWSLFASLRVFDYDDYDCELDLATVVPSGGGNGNGNGNGPPPRARGRAVGRRLAQASVDDVVGAASRLVPREAALLDSSAALGLSAPVAGQWIGGAELYRDVERIDGSETLTGLVFAGRRLSDAWSIELSLGYSLADDIDDTAFAGVRVTASL